MSTLSVKSNDMSFNLPDIRVVGAERPLQWLKMGLHDMKRAWPISLAYGVFFAALGWGLVNYAWKNTYLSMVLTTGFLLVAPFFALGFYEVSRRLEHRHGLRGIQRHFSVIFRNISSTGLFALFLGFILSAWERISALMVGVFFNGDFVSNGYFSLGALFSTNHLGFLVPYALFGAVIATLVFCMSAVSLPMLIDRRVDMVTAIVTSLVVVKNNALPMLIWAGIIVSLSTIGFLTWFVGLVVVFPLLGHATWHAYRELVGRS